jgi:hypothetical protein
MEMTVTKLLVIFALAVGFIGWLQTEERAWHRCTTQYSDATCVAILQR